MKRLAVIIAIALCFSAGCGGRKLAPNSDVDAADQALRTALEAWKSGKSQTELEAGQPSILMNEDDWRVGKRLLEFKMEPSGLSGRQVRCKVHIKLQDKDQKPAERDAVYIIDTIPRIVIVRDSFASA
jgi:hypothetical protein